MGTTFIEDELLKRSSNGILTPMNDGDYMGLTDLIAGVTPTLVDWTNDPTDAADITDGDITTFCNTGDKVAGGGWQDASFDWDLGGFYDVSCVVVGNTGVSAGTGYIIMYFWDGAAYRRAYGNLITGTTRQHSAMFSGRCSKVRLSLHASVAATVTPNIREFHVWRL